MIKKIMLLKQISVQLIKIKKIPSPEDFDYLLEFSTIFLFFCSSCITKLFALCKLSKLTDF